MRRPSFSDVFHDSVRMVRPALPRLVVRRTARVGRSPGTVTYDGPERSAPVHLTLTCYGAEHFEETPNAALEAAIGALKSADTGRVVWLDVDGVHDSGIIQKLGHALGWHPLVQEDIVDTGQRPKLDDHGSYLAVSLNATHREDEAGQEQMATVLQREQVTLVMGAGYVVSFQESYGDPFDPVRHRLRSGQGRFRHRQADYLAYALIDVIVDRYFADLESIGDRIEALEEAAQLDPDPSFNALALRLRRDLILVRRAAWPLREVLSAMERSDSALIADETDPFLRDAYDHTVQVLDIVEALREVLSGAGDLYLATVSHRMNEVMQMLTLVGTIFIPLTFIAGIYGMNFAVMPELAWPYAYPVALGFMAMIAGVLLLYFRRKGWL